jgi:hypothetical protein
VKDRKGVKLKKKSYGSAVKETLFLEEEKALFCSKVPKQCSLVLLTRIE